MRDMFVNTRENDGIKKRPLKKKNGKHKNGGTSGEISTLRLTTPLPAIFKLLCSYYLTRVQLNCIKKASLGAIEKSSCHQKEAAINVSMRGLYLPKRPILRISA